MRHDAPAALPLIAFIAGLASAPWLVAPLWCALGFAAIFVLALRHWPRAAVASAVCALGVFIALRGIERREREDAAFARVPAERFVTIEAPIAREWMPRGASHILRVDRFTADGVPFERGLVLFARFEPPPVGIAERVRVEGFLRETERGNYSVAIKSDRLLRYGGALPWWSPERWNRELAMRLRAHAAAYPREEALAEALVLGRGERLDEETRASFRRGGTYHLLVFSGLQIALAAAAIALLLRWVHAPRASDWLLLTFAIVSPLFIGPTASVARAAIGIGLYALSRILKRPTSIENLWCLSALVRLIVAPGDLTDVSFHLTYAGAGALLFAAKHRRLASLVAAELALTPLTLFHFHQFALGGSITTVLLTPLILAMLAVSALACALPVAPLFEAIGVMHRACVAINDLAALGSGFFAAPPIVALAFGYGAALLAIACTRDRRRSALFVLAMCIPLGAAIVRGTRVPPRPQLVVLDVGQGDAILARDGRHVLLVDGGGRMEDARFGESTLLPLLVDRGIRRIDVVLLTHAHPDHCGGLPAVLEQLEVGSLWISPRRFSGPCADRLLTAAAERHTPIHLVRDSDRQPLGALFFTTIAADRTFKRAKENNGSVLVRLQMEKCRILLTGDIEREAEWHLGDRDLRADVLKVAHHGSRSSSTSGFLDAVAPRVAAVSCGRHNLFGHPHPAVVEELGRRGIRLWRTDRNGNIEIEPRGHAIVVRPQIDTPQ